MLHCPMLRAICYGYGYFILQKRSETLTGNLSCLPLRFYIYNKDNAKLIQLIYLKSFLRYIFNCGCGPRVWPVLACDCHECRPGLAPTPRLPVPSDPPVLHRRRRRCRMVSPSSNLLHLNGRE